jgi:transcriptional regulator with XRE-family HTH domain
MNIGTLIKEKRTEKNLTMKQLADKMEVSEATISRWESGDIENIKRKKIVMLSKVLDISIYDIMGWVDPKTVKSTGDKYKDDQIKRLIHYFNALSSENKKQAISYLEFLKSQENNEEED